MSTHEFVQEILEESQEELDEIRKLQELLEQLDREESRVYTVSVTSNL